MSEPPPRTPLTVDQVEQALERLGPATPKDGQGHCPVCGPAAGGHDQLWTLAYRQNGNGAHLECSNGCPPGEIIGAIRLASGSAMAPPSVAPAAPLELVRRALEEADPEHLGGLQGIVRYGQDGDVIELRFENRRLDLGSSEQLQRQDHFLRRIARTGAYPDPLSGKNYRALMRAIVAAAEQREGVGTLGDEVTDWLETYLKRTGHRRDQLDLTTTNGKLDAIAAADNGQPYTDAQRRLHIRPAAVATWLKRNDIAHLTSRDLMSRLAVLGFHGQQISARGTNGQAHKVRVWVSPPDFVHGGVPTSPIRENEYVNTTRGDRGDNGHTHIESGKTEVRGGDSRGDTAQIEGTA